MKYDLVIQIVNYNTKGYLINCLNGLLQDLHNTGIIYKINVLDNNSEDDLSDLSAKFKDVNMSVYVSIKNIGFGAGHNLLSGKDDTYFILILNPDIEFLERGTIDRLLIFMRKHPEVSILGPRIVSHDNRTLVYDHGELRGIKAWYKNSLGESYWADSNKSGEVAWISGAFFLIRKETFELVRGFDERFFMYKEEEDLCLRARKLGHKVYYYPPIKIFHHSEVTSKKSDFIEQSKRYYIQKHLEGKFKFEVVCLLRYVYCSLRKLIRKPAI
jgi:GT2 family glycosyltransferase